MTSNKKNTVNSLYLIAISINSIIYIIITLHSFSLTYEVKFNIVSCKFRDTFIIIYLLEKLCSSNNPMMSVDAPLKRF